MRHYSTDFFCDKEAVPTVKSRPLGMGKTITTELQNINMPSSRVILFFDNESDYIEFVNRVKADYERFRKEQGYGRI